MYCNSHVISAILQKNFNRKQKLDKSTEGYLFAPVVTEAGGMLRYYEHVESRIRT